MTVKFISNMNRKQRHTFYRIIITIILLLFIALIPSLGRMDIILYIIPYSIIGYDIIKKGYKGILKRQVFDENFLMMIATIGAFLLGEYAEANAVMLFYQIGELFQSYAVGRSRASISSLMDIRAEYANLYQEDGTYIEVDPYELKIDNIIVVKPGEKIPVDGIIIQGETTLNLSALNGESLPKDVYCGDEVLSGSINMTAMIQVRVTTLFEDSTVSKIFELVEDASSHKSKMENFISRFAKWYTPFVCYCALALAIIPPFVLLLFQQEVIFQDWLFRALTFLVISCPCALVISIPMTFFAGLGSASSKGILMKGSNYLEALSMCDTIVFDKTGTLTKGVFQVNEIHGDERVLEYAAYGEYHSIHPIAKGIREAYKQEIQPQRIQEYKDYGGKGIEATLDHHPLHLGTYRFMQELGIECPKIETSQALVYVAYEYQYLGYILLSDVLKEEAKDSLSTLKQMGIQKTIMLSGDQQIIAQQIGKQMIMDEVYAQCLPHQKVEKLEMILSQSKQKVAYVGDGVNDAPVLMRADVGIAMGALGSDAAIEAADIVLMDDQLSKLPLAMKISKKCMRIVHQNLIFAIGVKFLCLILGAFGFTNMWMAIFADVGVMFLAVCNALRAMR